MSYWIINFLLILQPVSAQDVPENEIPVPRPPRAPGNNLIELITTISNTILLLVGIVAVLFLIIGGFQYITSAGNPETVNKAKSTIIYAILGLIITLLSWVIVTFIINALRAGG